MTTSLERIRRKAKQHGKLKFTSLAHHLTPAFLKETWRLLNRRGAAGVDGVTIREFEVNLDNHITNLHGRIRQGLYRPPPVRRVYIPKGNGKSRPLGIPTVEDRLLQAAVARILSAVFENDFLDVSFGYRPRRSAHDALRTIRGRLIGGKVMHVFEADIEAYFDRVNHDWLKKMLQHRIADPSLLRLISRWLRAGVMEHGLRLQSPTGVPQGGPISPLLANVYLHYALDLWFERIVKHYCRGYAGLVRYADDFLVCFQYESDAKRFGQALHGRMKKFGLTLSPKKTRRLLFGRFARERRGHLGKKPDEFTFLGFRHICGIDRSGKFAVVRLPSQKALRRFRDRIKQWLWNHMHWKVRDQQRHLSQMLLGFYRYFALPHCGSKLSGVHMWTMACWRKILRRRSQRSRTHWSYLKSQEWFHLPTPVTLHLTV